MKRLQQISNQVEQSETPLQIENVLPEITQLPVFQYKPYNGEFLQFLQSSNLQYNNIYQYYSQYYGTFDKHESFYHTHLRKNLQVFDLHEVFFNKNLMEDIICKEYNKDSCLKYGQIALVFKANKQAQGHIDKYHGGLTATIIDDIMGKSCMLFSNNEMVATTDLNTKYKGPLNVGQEYIALNKVVKIDEKNIILQCDVMNVNQQVLVTATGVFRKLVKNNNKFQELTEFFLRNQYKNLPQVQQLLQIN